MMSNEVFVAYAAVNLLLAAVLRFKASGKAHQETIARFYLFCVICLGVMGVMAHYLPNIQTEWIRHSLHSALVFLYSMLPFFFLHFMVLFVRRGDILKSRWMVAAMYFAGLFSYTMILLDLIPEPIKANDQIASSGFVFYLTWQSIFFCVGIAMLYEHMKGFYGKVEKANLLFTGFAVLLLVLPGPFTETLFFSVLHLNLDWYFTTCTFALMFGVYFIFRHKIVVNTIYDALKQALSVMNDIFVLTDERFQIQMVRGAVTPLLKYSEKDLLGTSLSDLVEQKHLLSAYREFAFGGKMKESYFDADVIMKNGERLPMNFSFTPVFSNNEITGFVSIGRSISELRHSEQELRLFMHTVESTPECICITNLHDRLIFVNEAFVRKYGYEREEILGKPIGTLWSTNNTPDTMKALRAESIKGGWKGELIATTKNGREFPVRLTISHIHNDKGETIGIANATEDITEEKLSQLALKASETKFRALFENVPIGVFQVTPESRFIAANPPLARMLGNETVDEQYLRNLEATLFPEAHDRDAWRAKMKEGGEIQNFEIKLRRNEKDIVLLINVHPVREMDGQIEYFEGTLSDITDRKKLEDDLRQAHKLESIGTLAGGIAHDFNNILQIVLLNIVKLRKGLPDPEKYASSIEPITRGVQRGAGLVRQLMTFARKTDVIFLSLDLNKAIDEIKKMLEQTLPANLEIKAELEQHLPKIRADQTQIHQVLLNLCVNARDAMPNGGKITIKSELLTPQIASAHFPNATGINYIVLSVSDTGTGMDEAVRARIFEPFFTTKGVGQGTGLGLAVTYGIVESHKGAIAVESALGVGTTFRIIIPFEAQEKVVEVVKKDSSARVEGGGETIMLVEDENDVRGVMVGALESKGYKVVVAADGVEAVEMYKKHHNEVALVLLDIGLPYLSGWDAYAQMKQVNDKVKAIVCSGFADPEKKISANDDGIKAFIPKPYDPDEILKTVREILDQSR
jgi:PAS domain S-box-containing protein